MTCVLLWLSVFMQCTNATSTTFPTFGDLHACYSLSSRSLKEEDVQAYAAEHPYHVIESSLSNYSKVRSTFSTPCSTPHLFGASANLDVSFYVYTSISPFYLRTLSTPGGLPAELFGPHQQPGHPRADRHAGAQVPAQCDRRVPGPRPGERLCLCMKCRSCHFDMIGCRYPNVMSTL